MMQPEPTDHSDFGAIKPVSPVRVLTPISAQCVGSWKKTGGNDSAQSADIPGLAAGTLTSARSADQPPITPLA